MHERERLQDGVVQRPGHRLPFPRAGGVLPFTDRGLVRPPEVACGSLERGGEQADRDGAERVVDAHRDHAGDLAGRELRVRQVVERPRERERDEEHTGHHQARNEAGGGGPRQDGGQRIRGGEERLFAERARLGEQRCDQQEPGRDAEVDPPDHRPVPRPEPGDDPDPDAHGGQDQPGELRLGQRDDPREHHRQHERRASVHEDPEPEPSPPGLRLGEEVVLHHWLLRGSRAECTPGRRGECSGVAAGSQQRGADYAPISARTGVNDTRRRPRTIARPATQARVLATILVASTTTANV